MTTIKFYFKDEIHRLTVKTPKPTFSQISSAVNKVFSKNIKNPKNIRIQYIDQEKDVVTINTEREWVEAWNHILGPESIKRIYLVELGTNRTVREGERIKKPAPAPVPEKKSNLDRIAHLISLGYDQKIDEIDKKDLSILKNILREKSASFLSGNREHIKARNSLLFLLRIEPRSSADLYNLACVYSLMGNKTMACFRLQEAIENGYTNLAHIKTDPDLDSIRGLAEFQEILSKMNGTKERRIDQISIEMAKCEIDCIEKELREEMEMEMEMEREALRKCQEIEGVPKELPKECHQDNPPAEHHVDAPAENLQYQHQQEQNDVQEVHHQEVHHQEKEDMKKRFELEMKILEDMGFEDEELNGVVLVAEDGDVERVMEILLTMVAQ